MLDQKMDIIDNSNIERTHLGRKGLHMKPHCTGKLAVNIIHVLKSLQPQSKMVSSSGHEVLQNLTQKSNTEIEANISHLQTSLPQNDDVISDNLD